MRYRATLARSGYALLLGGGCVGLGVALTAWAGGEATPLSPIGWWLLGTVFGTIAIAGIGGPVWWLSQRGRARGPIAAGLTGALVSGGGVLAVLTRGFGAGLPVADGATLAAMWTSAGATALVAAFLGGLIALAMWLVSYRPT